MTDAREALIARLERAGMGYGLHDGLKREVLGSWADAILAEFDVTPRGKGTTIQIGGRRADKTQALAERVAEEVTKRGGSATVISLPTVEDVRDEIAGHPIGSGYYATAVAVDEATEIARAVLALLPGRTEREVKAEGWDEGDAARRMYVENRRAGRHVTMPRNPYRQKEANDE